MYKARINNIYVLHFSPDRLQSNPESLQVKLFLQILDLQHR